MPGGKYPVQLYQADNVEKELIKDSSLSIVAGLSKTEVGNWYYQLSHWSMINANCLRQHIKMFQPFFVGVLHTFTNPDFNGSIVIVYEGRKSN